MGEYRPYNYKIIRRKEEKGYKKGGMHGGSSAMIK